MISVYVHLKILSLTILKRYRNQSSLNITFMTYKSESFISNFFKLIIMSYTLLWSQINMERIILICTLRYVRTSCAPCDTEACRYRAKQMILFLRVTNICGNNCYSYRGDIFGERLNIMSSAVELTACFSLTPFIY